VNRRELLTSSALAMPGATAHGYAADEQIDSETSRFEIDFNTRRKKWF
jgi:hypothetical protein